MTEHSLRCDSMFLGVKSWEWNFSLISPSSAKHFLHDLFANDDSMKPPNKAAAGVSWMFLTHLLSQ